MNEKELKDKLSSINKQELNLNQEEIKQVVNLMLTHIGSSDPVLRDELIYSSLSKWIADQKISIEYLREMLSRCLDNLTHGLGETESDTVFTRTFSILIITAILYYHNHKTSFLSMNEVHDTCRKVIHYSLAEDDLRGYVINKGWAHSVAHFADCLDELANCTDLDDKELIQILNVIQSKVKIDHILFAFGEDERLVTAVISVFSREEINMETKIEWLNSFVDIRKPSKFSNFPNDYWFNVNIKSFIRSLYFRTLLDEEFKLYNQHIFQTLTIIKQKFPQY